MEVLVARGITRLLVEGGPALWRAFGAQALADEVALYVAGGAKSQDEAEALRFAAHHLGPLPLTTADTRALGPDRLWRLRWNHHKQEGH